MALVNDKSNVTERGVIASLVNHGSEKLPLALSRMLDNAPESFDDLRYGTIARAVFGLRRDGKEVSPLTVRKALLDADEVDLAGVALQLMAEDLPVDLASEDAERLWPAYQARRAKTLLAEALDAAKANPGIVPDLLRRLPVALTSIADEAQGAGDLPAITDAAEFLAEPIAEPPVLVGGILHQGSKLVFGGSSKSFKTWSLLDLALSVATGADWLGFPTTQGKVLFLNFEIQPHAWQRRIAAVCNAKSTTLQPGLLQVWNLRGKAADFRTLIPKVIAGARREAFALIVLDPVYKLYGSTDENAAGDVAALLNSLEALASETGAAVAFGAHFAKGNASGKEAIDRISGSGVFARDPDSLLVFTKHQEDDAFVVEPILRNFPPLAPFTVRWQFPLMERADELDPAKLKRAGGRKPGHSPEELLALLPEAGITNSCWEAAAKEKGIGRSTYYRLQKQLQTTGQAHKSAGGTTWLKSAR